MKKHFLAVLIVLVVAAGAAFAQTPQDNISAQYRQTQVFQQAVIFNGSGSQPVVAGMIGSDGRMGLLNVPGKPFSATEVRRSVQSLANGVKIEHSDSNLLYRDDQGRTRVEQTLGSKSVVVIMDPVARLVTILNSDAKTARRMAIPATAQEGGVSVANGGVTMQWKSTTQSQATAEGHVTVALSKAIEFTRAGIAGGQHTSEDLGLQLVNGVMAQGSRNTQVIPAQSIGNDRELQVVDEHWFSTDMQMLVKSVNSDPRFGETTYQLTNIVRGGQDPTLFQVPADYNSSTDMKLDFQPIPVVVK